MQFANFFFHFVLCQPSFCCILSGSGGVKIKHSKWKWKIFISISWKTAMGRLDCEVNFSFRYLRAFWVVFLSSFRRFYKNILLFYRVFFKSVGRSVLRSVDDAASCICLFMFPELVSLVTFVFVNYFFCAHFVRVFFCFVFVVYSVAIVNFRFCYVSFSH